MSESFVGAARYIQADPTLVQTDPLPSWASLGDNNSMLDKYRPELYALLAIVADRIVSDALDDRDIYPPFGFNEGQEDVTTLGGHLKELRIALDLTLSRRSDRTLAEMRRSESAPIVSRLDDLVDLFSRADESPRYRSLSRLVYAGFDTASSQTVSSLAAISRIVFKEHPDATNEEIAAIARRSSILIRRVASLNLYHLDHVTRRVSRAGTQDELPKVANSRVLKLKQTVDGQEFVDFVSPIKELRDPRNGHLRVGDLIESDYRTLGCPALAKLGEWPSAINRIWSWAVDIADQEDLFLDRDYTLHSS